MDEGKLPNHVNIVLCVWLFFLTCVFSICFVSHRLKILVKIPYNMELYNCKKVDITDNDQKERVNQMIEDQKPFKGKPLLVASASGKWTQLFPWLKVVFLCVVFPARVFPHTIANRPKSSLFVFVKLSHSMQKLCVCVEEKSKWKSVSYWMKKEMKWIQGALLLYVQAELKRRKRSKQKN